MIGRLSGKTQLTQLWIAPTLSYVVMKGNEEITCTCHMVWTIVIHLGNLHSKALIEMVLIYVDLSCSPKWVRQKAYQILLSLYKQRNFRERNKNLPESDREPCPLELICRSRIPCTTSRPGLLEKSCCFVKKLHCWCFSHSLPQSHIAFYQVPMHWGKGNGQSKILWTVRPWLWTNVEPREPKHRCSPPVRRGPVEVRMISGLPANVQWVPESNL